MIGRTAAAAFALAVTLALSACRSNGPEDPAPASPAPADGSAAPLADIRLPDLARADAAVQAQARDLHADLIRTKDAGAPDPELGSAFGALGMLLHAGEYLDAAEPCYLNAQRLMPREARWPYYLGLLHEARGRTAEAAAAFARVLEIEPADVPALIHLGQLRLDGGDPAAAEELYARARAQAPGSVAPLAGLGRAALARQQHGEAVRYLEEGLSIDPQALSLHAPLANAYRRLGQIERAEAHTRQWRNTEVALHDPRRLELDALLQSGLSYELRGIRALAAEDWKGAADLFRQGIGVAPAGSPLRRSLHHKLGTALWMLGDTPGALSAFEQVVRLAPREGSDEPAAKAHYSLGIVAASEGRSADAVKHLSAAVRYQPDYGDAFLALGDAQRRIGQFADALSSYRDAVRVNPRAPGARFGYALALVRLRRYVEARDWLAESLAIQPDRPELALALARILVAAPDARVRDGRRGLELAQQLAASQQTPEVAETLAMALAETGDFARAVEVQRSAFEAVRASGQAAAARRLSHNLRLFEQRQPCRTPWRDDDPVHMPGPPGVNG